MYVEVLELNQLNKMKPLYSLQIYLATFFIFTFIQFSNGEDSFKFHVVLTGILFLIFTAINFFMETKKENGK